jgi:alpha-L-fucosidase
VYGTRGGPFRNGEWGGSTLKGKTVYLHILKWDENQLKLPPLKARIIRGEALTGGNVKIEQTDAGTIIRMPVRRQNKVNTVVKLEMETPVPLE